MDGRNQQSAKCTKTSGVWKHFSIIDRNHAHCNVCNTKLSYRTSITNLRKHLIRKHSMDIDIIKPNHLGYDNSENILSNKKKGTGIWKYFMKVDKYFAICQMCKMQFSYRTSTSNLAKHLTRKHSTVKFSPDMSISKTKLLINSNATDSETSETELMETMGLKSGLAKLVSELNEPSQEQFETIELEQINCKNSLPPSECGDSVSEYGDQQSELTDNLIDSTQAESISEVETHKYKRRKKSRIWEHFTIIDHEFAFCNTCKVRLSFRTSVTNLKKHYIRKHSHEDCKDKINNSKSLETSELVRMQTDPKCVRSSSILMEALPSERDFVSTSSSRKQSEPTTWTTETKFSSQLTEPPILIPEKTIEVVAPSARQAGEADKFGRLENTQPHIKQNEQRSVEDDEDIFGKFVASELRRIKNKKYYLEVKKTIQIALIDTLEKEYEDYNSQA